MGRFQPCPLPRNGPSEVRVGKYSYIFPSLHFQLLLEILSSPMSFTIRAMPVGEVEASCSSVQFFLGP